MPNPEERNNNSSGVMTGNVMMASGVIKIPDFDRHTDPIRWLKIYESNMTVVNVTDENKLKVIPGYIKSTVHLDWFYDHTFEDWESFKKAFIERFSKSKVKINNILSNLLGIKKGAKESMRQYVDRSDHLVASYNQQRKAKADWNELNASVLKDTFVNGIRPLALKMLVKQHLPQSLSAAHNGDDSESEESEDSEESEVEEEIVVKKRVKKLKDHSGIKNSHVLKGDSKNEKLVKKTDTKVNEVEKKVDDLTKHLQKLTLLVENGAKINQVRKPLVCYNCQDEGHNAHECQRECKICRGKHGGHAFWNCPEYKNPRNRESYLVLKSSNNKEPIESYAADKRLRSTDSERDVRVTRSGKKIKVHDTAPKETLIKRNESKMKKARATVPPEKVSTTVTPEEVRSEKKPTEVKKKRVPTSKSPNAINAEEILQAKVFQVSLEQLLPLKGLRSEIFQKTKRVRNKKANVVNEGADDMELYHISRSGKIRLSTEANSQFVGDPRVTAIVDGCMQGDALLDPGSHGSIISNVGIRFEGFYKIK
ncbi:hypothetical protein BD770DRAFT_450044 [Pilaira anomala]|nr:hypothetical protein BD770DRAFT_450044 [Pilaira anomala]